LYDVIIVGGGYNGFIIIVYLVRVGMKVICFECCDIFGGVCVIEEFWFGVCVLWCFYVVLML